MAFRTKRCVRLQIGSIPGHRSVLLAACITSLAVEACVHVRACVHVCGHVRMRARKRERVCVGVGAGAGVIRPQHHQATVS